MPLTLIKIDLIGDQEMKIMEWSAKMPTDRLS